MNTAFGTCKHCGGHHDRLHVLETAPGVYTGECPATHAPIELHIGVAALPPDAPQTAAAERPPRFVVAPRPAPAVPEEPDPADSE